uniref:G_PROTEIN_RECEP_F1_2 domain-containing protein n=1 Tax=Rhabditophanes sp. KR3021 TaxID=114890 RepID=A0AC35TXZ1_9BILA
MVSYHRIAISFILNVAYANVGIITFVVLFRFLYAHNRYSLTKRHFVGAILANFIIPGILGVCLFLSFDPSLPEDVAYNYELNLGSNRNLSLVEGKSLVLQLSDPNLYLTFAGYLLYFLINWIVLFIAFVKWFHVMKNEKLTDKTKKLNRDFMIILLVQSIAPIILTAAPILFYFGTIMMGFKIKYVGTYCVVLLNLCPTLNGLLFVFLSKNHRTICLNFVLKVKAKLFRTSFATTARISTTAMSKTSRHII